MKTQKLKFSEIKTAEQLRERVLNGTLSVGNRFAQVAKFLRATGAPADRVTVYYTAHPGAHCVTRYLAA